MGVGIHLGGTQHRIPPELAEQLRDIPRNPIEWLAEALSRAAGMGAGIWIFTGLILLGLPLIFVLAYKWR